MIVKDKEKLIDLANNSAWDAYHLILDDVKGLECEDDPAEYLYYMAHSAAFTAMLMFKSMRAYSGIYGIEELGEKKAREWVEEIMNEYMKSLKVGS